MFVDINPVSKCGFDQIKVNEITKVADRITVLVNGAVLTEGTPEAIAQDPQVKAVYLGHGEGAHV